MKIIITNINNKLLWLIILALIILGGCSPQNSQKEIIISAAASLQKPLEEITESFHKQNPELKVVINFGGSRALEQQIEQGSPIDIFISAAAKSIDALESKNLIIKDSRIDLLKNTLVLVVPSNSLLIDFHDLATSNIAKIAIGNPTFVPAGDYAQETLTNLELWGIVKNKLIMTQDVRQVVGFVETGNVDAGFVYQTDAILSKNIKVAQIVPQKTHTPIVYPATVIKSSKNLSEAKHYLNFLQSKEAKAIFKKFGFTTL